jgi:hypothetical protein
MNPHPKTDHLVPWQSGQSGNPYGQRTHRVTLAKHVRELSSDGHELVSFLFSVARGEPMHLPGQNGKHANGRPPRPSLDQRLRAVELLLDRGWGRPKETIELLEDSSAPAERRALLDHLSDDDLATLKGILARGRIAVAMKSRTSIETTAEPVREGSSPSVIAEVPHVDDTGAPQS